MINLAEKSSKNDSKQAIEYAEEAFIIGERKQDQKMMARARRMLEYRKALHYFDLSLKIYLAEDDKLSVGQNYINMAEIYEKFKQRDSVRMCYFRALDYYRETELADGLAAAYTGLAGYYQWEGKFDSARIFIGKGLKAAMLSESIEDLFNSYNTAGNIYFQQGHYREAMEYYRKALLFAVRNGNRENESIVKSGISRNFAVMGHFDSAYNYLSQAYAIEDSLYRRDEIQNSAYLFAEHSMESQLEKETEAEQMQRRLCCVIVGLCVVVIAIMTTYLQSKSARQKKIESINAELNKYRSDLEHALKDRTRELILSEQQLQNLSNNLPNGAIFRLAFENERLNENEGKTLYVSSGWENLTGQSIVEVEDSVFFFHNRIHPDDRRELLHALADTIRNRTILDKIYRFYKNNTEMRWFHVRAVAIAGDKGLTYVDGYQVDETEQKHFEHELITARNKAEESDKLKSAFLANMSHEIRTPMNTIISFSSMLSNNQLTPQRQTSYLELIQENCQRLLRLIDDIVDISKIEAGQLSLRMETLPLSEIMTVVRDYFELATDAGYPNVELWIDDSLLNSSLMVHTDVFRLKQIFVNLIENAMKFTEKGFVRCGLLLDRTDAVHFYVMDTGAGISHENIENIFQSFRKLDQFSDGTGLGLSIVRRVLLQMGGSIWVESEPGVGSTFHFTLPLKK